MKKNLEIVEFENKATNAEPPKIYTRFNTNEGWLSCFSATASEELKKFKGKVACVETKESIANKGTDKERVFQNIDKCYGEESDEESDEVEVVKMANGVNIQPKKATNSNASMYASYAKDVFVKLIRNYEERKEDIVYKEVMHEAIELVKQAKEAFE